MLTDITWTIHRQYKSKTNAEPLAFFSECLCNSIKFDLLLGYFSSAAINVLSDGFATFIYNGGCMRLVINNVLSAQDKDAILSGVSDNERRAFDLSDIEKLKETLDKYDTHFFECLAWLIAQNRIEIKIITPKNKTGIAHTKSGMFSDGINTVGFNGSCNFTQNALLYNIESIDAYCSWDGPAMIAKISNSNKLFEKTFDGTDSNVNYLDPSNIIVAIRDNFYDKEINDLIFQEKDLIESRAKAEQRPSIRRALDKARRTVERTIESIEMNRQNPKFPYTEGPRTYQTQAYQNWISNGYKGIFAMATGTGKTITSLNCLYEMYKTQGFYRAIILVPTIALVSQWESECAKFNFNKIIVVNSKIKWKDTFGVLQALSLLGKNNSFVVIVTYASFVKRNFQVEFNNLPKDTLFIADEAHNLGAPSMLRNLKNIHLEKRIGLSATPERQYGELENQKIKFFYNETTLDYTFEYSMHDAINKEPTALCSYRYYPRIVKLTKDEFAKYIAITKQISKVPEPRNKEQQEIFEMLCLKRQRIIHKAENKIEIFKEILKEEYFRRGNLKYTLVYTPEGGLENDFNAIKIDNPHETDEDLKLINIFTSAVSSIDNHIAVRQFTGETQGKERSKMLEAFTKGEIDVLTSMKCLDEGVDIPRAELAVFCSSTGNPRQFIQRRGRVLRKHPLKKEATIYDLIVIPDISEDPNLYNIEKNEIHKELKRVKDFASLSLNHYESLRVLKPILEYYNLNI